MAHWRSPRSFIRWPLLLGLLVAGLASLSTLVSAQPLSSQVLQLLTRVNTWTGRQTFYDLRLIAQTPTDTTDRLYTINGGLYWNGSVLVIAGGGITPHALLSTTHSDTDPSAAVPVAGALIVGVGTAPALWTRLSIGAAGTLLRSNGVNAVWSSDGSALTALNASQLTSGIVPVARLANLTDATIDVNAAIAWSKVSKTGSNLADLATRSATDLNTGTLSDARLSVAVSLFGTAVDTGEIANGTVQFADWSANSCISGQYPQYNGAIWVCGSITPGAGTVTSVALTAPAFLTVGGSPILGAGTFTLSLATQLANLVFAGPSSGAAAAPTFRALAYADFPASGVTPGTFPKVTVNTQGIVTAGIAQITLTTDVTGVLPLANGGTNLNAAADDSVLLSTGAAWAAVAITNCATALTYATASNSFGCAAGSAAHALLSASHSDTLAAGVTRGDLIVGSAVPQWTRLATGAAGTFLVSNGTNPAWGFISSAVVAGVHTVGIRNTQAGATAGTSLQIGNDINASLLELRAFSSAFTAANNVSSVTSRGAGGFDLVQVGGAASIRTYVNTTVLASEVIASGEVEFPQGIVVGDPAVVTPTTIDAVLTSSSTWNPTSIATGAAQGTTIPLVGVTIVGDSAACWASLTTLGVVDVAITAHPASADNVRVVLTNNTGSAQDFASGTLRVVCTVVR